MALEYVFLTLAVVGLVHAYFKLFYRKLRPGEPPVVPGHFLFGNGKDFNEHAVRFLSKARDRLGDVFTIRFFHQYWTIILDVHSFEKFSREKNFDFNLVQEQVNRNVFHYRLKNARKMISEAGQKVNGKYLFSYMDSFANNLGASMKSIFSNEDANSSTIMTDKTVINNSINQRKNTELYNDVQQHPADINIERLLANNKMRDEATDGWRTDYLREVASETFFAAVFYTIFGHGKGDEHTTFNPRDFHQNFDKFHKYFNYLWLGLPRKLFPMAGEAAGVLANQPSGHDMVRREGCSEYIKFATDFMYRNNQTEADIVGHNLVFLHVNYNTFRAVFWCMYKLMEDKKALEALRKELEEAIEAKRSGDASDRSVEFTVEDINKLQVLDSFFKEIIRWSSGVFMVRYCTEDTEFTTSDGRTYKIRGGDRVAIYPPVIHKDPEIFENPEEFIYDRFVNAEFFKKGKRVKNPIIGFGSLCPGQKVTALEIKWFVMNLINTYKMELAEGHSTEPNTAMYGHEILPPVNDVLVRMKAKEGVCPLTFINNYRSKANVQV